jgi:hypothetical protein
MRFICTVYRHGFNKIGEYFTCIRPAVSISTTSFPSSVALEMEAFATADGSLAYP